MKNPAVEQRGNMMAGKTAKGFYMTDELWIKIINDIKKNPRDLQTIPLRGGGIWFHVCTNIDGVTILVGNAKTKKPSSKLSQIRVLRKENFVVMHDIYLRRKAGEHVAKEALKASRSIVYIYSIFKNCGGI
jgi:hypothetical protein